MGGKGAAPEGLTLARSGEDYGAADPEGFGCSCLCEHYAGQLSNGRVTKPDTRPAPEVRPRIQRGVIDQEGIGVSSR